MQTLVNVTLPEMGESVSEGSIVEWRKKVGDWVDEGETIVDITTDKVDVEVPSSASGLITALHGAEGSTVAVGSVLAEIDTKAEKPAHVSLSPSKGEPASTPPAAPKGEPTLVTPASYGAPGTAEAPAEARSANGKPGGTLSHHARRLVDRLHLDPAKLTGTL